MGRTAVQNSSRTRHRPHRQGDLTFCPQCEHPPSLLVFLLMLVLWLPFSLRLTNTWHRDHSFQHSLLTTTTTPSFPSTTFRNICNFLPTCFPSFPASYHPPPPVFRYCIRLADARGTISSHIRPCIHILHTVSHRPIEFNFTDSQLDRRSGFWTLLAKPTAFTSELCAFFHQRAHILPSFPRFLACLPTTSYSCPAPETCPSHLRPNWSETHLRCSASPSSRAFFAHAESIPLLQPSVHIQYTFPRIRCHRRVSLPLQDSTHLWLKLQLYICAFVITSPGPVQLQLLL